MGEKTGIEWCDATFNPWWGCTKVSPACTNCYAESSSKRFGHSIWGDKAPRRFLGEKHWSEPLRWNEKAKASREPFRIFCASMADILESREDLLREQQKLWRLIESTPALTWLLLTKRPENAPDLLPSAWFKEWPRHVWFGITTENQKYLEERWQHAALVPAGIHFLSVEPLLGELDFERVPQPGHPKLHYNVLTGHWSHYWEDGQPDICEHWERETVDWVILAGESGGPPERALVERESWHGQGGMKYGPWEPKPKSLERVRAIRDQCEIARVPFFFKAWGGQISKSGGRLLDGRTWDEFPS